MTKYALLVALVSLALLLAWQATPHAAAGMIAFDRGAALALSAIAAAVAWAWPLLDPGLADAPMAPLVAFVGCDGAGKSTLAEHFVAAVGAVRPTRGCYLGLGSGALGERIRALPLIGPAAARRLERKARQTRTRGEKIPGLATALVVYLFSLARLRRFRRMLSLRRAGTAVITDRYPQIEIPGFYDGPGLSAARAGGWVVTRLAREERRIYAWMATFHPDLVVRLNVDVETAHRRKPDHGYELLRAKVEVTPRLSFSGAEIVDLDTRRSWEAVTADAAVLLDKVFRPGTAFAPTARC